MNRHDSFSAQSSGPDRDHTRFRLELEFLCCLANPAYLQWLSQQPYFHSDQFKGYLSYLSYFKHLPYVSFVPYPNALLVLDWLVQVLTDKNGNENAFSRNEIMHLIHSQQYLHWKMQQPEKAPLLFKIAPDESGLFQ